MINIYCIHTAHAAVCESEVFNLQYNLSKTASCPLSPSVQSIEGKNMGGSARICVNIYCIHTHTAHAAVCVKSEVFIQQYNLSLPSSLSLSAEQ